MFLLHLLNLLFIVQLRFARRTDATALKSAVNQSSLLK